MIVHPSSNLQGIAIPFALRNKIEQLVDDDTEESCTSIKEPLGKFSCNLSLLMPRMEKQDSVRNSTKDTKLDVYPLPRIDEENISCVNG